MAGRWHSRIDHYFPSATILTAALRWTAVFPLAVGLALGGCGRTEDGAPPRAAEQPTGASAPVSPTPLPDVPSASASPSEREKSPSPTRESPFAIRSPAFPAGDPIPPQFSCEGENISPPLEWSEPPAGTAAFALIADDPDAPGGTWVHWVLFNLPLDRRGLPAAIPTDGDLSDGGLQGSNSAGRTGYTGPCPPSGTHHYFFKLYALDTELGLPAGASKAELQEAMAGHVLDQAETLGTYSR